MSTSSLYSSSSLSTASKAASTMEGMFIWTIISLVLAIVGAILVYVLFLSKKNEGKFKGFVAWLYDFLGFKNLVLEVILKVSYLFAALFITLESLGTLFSQFVPGVLMLVLGNLGIRVAYEFSLMMVMLCRNTAEINKKLTPKAEDKTQE